MPSINFPASPDVNELFTSGNTTWRWDGVSWVSNSTFNGRMPEGTTAERPATPIVGQIRLNTDVEVFEGYTSNGWRTLAYLGTVIETPTGISPAANANVVVDTTFTLTGSTYTNLVGFAHESSDWQISTESDFGNTVVNVSASTTALTSYEVTGGLSSIDTYYWRVRYRDVSDNVSDWSTGILFDIIATVPTAYGQAYCGGIYMGTICAAGSCYYLIVSPNSTGCASCCWKTTNTTTANASSSVDGYLNTYTALTNATHPAGNWCATRTINGFSDWYLPAINELSAFYTNGAYGNNESVIGVGEAFSDSGYWSSTQCYTTAASRILFDSGVDYAAFKNSLLSVRAVRREPV